MSNGLKRLPGAESDEQLVEHVKAGDREAFETLYRRFFPRIYRFVQKRMGNRSDVEETVQEIFIATFSSLGAFRGEAPFGAWVYGLARRTIANRFKRKRAETVPWSETDIALSDAASTVHDDANGADPHATYERNERLAQLESAARQLSPSQWEYFRLHHLEDVPIEEIARDAHVSRDAIKSHLYRARKLLLAR
ncbi:MAG TPA: RNA polymerase sigma factor [Myxococcota bacterium]|nr:RNA polymerase sigma factor [Myxococcota bacterium]